MSDTLWLPRVGDRVDRYEIVAELARGGMAQVFAVRRRAMGGFGRLSAMKVLLPQLRDERQFIDMFLDEARLASAIHHANVVQVFDLGEERGTPFLVMELVRGISLSELTKRAANLDKRVPLPVALQILAHAAEGLHAAHETRGDDGEPLGIVHRDVSPHNVMVGFDGHTKVTDFGIAAGRGRITTTRSGEVRGKLGYLAPEQIKRLHALDRRVDVWALAVVAWELLAGRRLFDDSEEAAVLYEIVSGELPELTPLAPDLPENVVAKLRACLERDRDKRPSNCRELAEVFSDALRALGGRGTLDVEKFVLELASDRKREIDQRLTDVESPEPKPEPKVDRAASTVADAKSAEQTNTDVAVSSSFAAPERRKSRRNLLIAGAVAAAVLGVVVVRFVISKPESHPVVAETPPPATASAPVPSASAPAVATRRITLPVAPDVRLVLIDQKLHEERPVVLELPPDASLRAKLVSKKGKVLERSITPSDDGSVLTLDGPSDAGKAPSPKNPNRPLFSNPY